MTISNPFSSANSTLTVFDNATAGEIAAMATLQTAINSALQLALTDPVTAKANRLTAYQAFETAASAQGTLSVASTVTTAKQADGYYSGTFTYTGGVTGVWTSKGLTTSAVNIELTLTSGAFPTGSSPYTTGFSFTVTGSHALDASNTGHSITTAANAVSSALVGKITAMGDTGLTAATISAKLLNEAGTYKAKGSSDEGELSVDFLRVPSDAGQILLFSAQEDLSINANRVVKITHNSSGQEWYGIVQVSTIKTTRGSIDNFVNAKATLLIQSGSVES